MADMDWIAWIFIAIGIACSLLAIVGYYAGHKKNRIGLAVYMGGVMGVLLLCLVLCTACWVLTEALDNHMDHKSDKDIQNIPCEADLHGCCCCNGGDYEEVNQETYLLIWNKVLCCFCCCVNVEMSRMVSSRHHRICAPSVDDAGLHSVLSVFLHGNRGSGGLGLVQ